MAEREEKILQYYDMIALGSAPEHRVGWHYAAMQSLVFEALLEVFDDSVWFGNDPSDPKISILDVGCGNGGLLKWLDESARADACSYSGIDLHPRLIREARGEYELWPHVFNEMDFDDYSGPKADLVVMSGTLGLLFKDRAKATRLIAKAWDTARYAVTFNVLTTNRPDGEVPSDVHALYDPAALYKQLRARYGRVTIREDVLEGMAFVYLYKPCYSRTLLKPEFYNQLTAKDEQCLRMLSAMSDPQEQSHDG